MSATAMYSIARETLRGGLRAAGHYLDENGCRLISLSITAQGVVVTLANDDLRRGGEAVLLTRDDLHALARQARAGRNGGNAPQSRDPLFPTGYEDFLRALEATAGQKGWTWLRLVRWSDVVILHYGARAERAEVVLNAQGVQSLLDNAFHQRGRGTAL